MRTPRLDRTTCRRCQRRRFWTRSSGRSAKEPLTRRHGNRLEFCYPMIADDDVYPMILPTARSRPAETQVLPHPALQRRTALRDRRPRAVRRHTGRVATRFAVLLTGDVIAIFIARVIALWLAADTVWGAEMFSQ